MDVYLDAVLYPNCVQDPKTFAQEGWHYELESPEVREANRAPPAIRRQPLLDCSVEAGSVHFKPDSPAR